jgi:hypothetical protein
MRGLWTCLFYMTIVPWTCLFNSRLWCPGRVCSTADCAVPWMCLFYVRLSCPGLVFFTTDCGTWDVSVLQQTVVPWMCLFYSRMCCTWTRLFNSSLHLLSRGVPSILQLVLHLASLTIGACAVPLHLLLC